MSWKVRGVVWFLPRALLTLLGGFFVLLSMAAALIAVWLQSLQRRIMRYIRPPC